MVQFIQAQNIGLAYLEERFSLQQAEDEAFFPEWFENLPEITDLENAVKMVVLSPLLDLAGFYRDPFFITTEESIELALEDEEEIVRGRIDVLIIQEQLWLLVIESKRVSFSLIEAIPQALTYMLANPNREKPVFGCVTSGEDFQFIKLRNQDKPEYALSDKFTLSRKGNELYKVLKILKNLSQILS